MASPLRGSDSLRRSARGSGRRLARLAVFCLTASVGGCAGPAPRVEHSVLFILVDDLGADLGSYGHPLVRSPNIDRLAAAGVRFDRAYAQFPLCHPSRTSMLSGRYPETTGVLDNRTHPRIALGNVAFLPEYFRAHGYHTRRFGKIVHTEFENSIAWGAPDPDAPPTVVRAPAKQARRRQDQQTSQELETSEGTRERQNPENDAPRRAVGWRAVSEEDGALLDGRTARRAVDWLDEHHEERFFLAVGFNKPHPPFVAPEPYFSLYAPDAVDLTPEPADHLLDLPVGALRHALADPAMPEAYRRRATVAYYACVSFVDAQIGLLLDAMDRHNLWDDTIVVLVSDHGTHLGEHLGLWRKGTLFERATRVPLIITAPQTGPWIVAAPVELVDVFPTMTELAGLPTPPGLQGMSLVPQLLDPSRGRQRPAYTVLGDGELGRSIRTDRYRYTEWPSGAELYDYATDPYEYSNLWSADDPHEAQSGLEQLLKSRARAAAAYE